MTKSYRELRSLYTFDDRLDYLLLGGSVGRETFGGRRALNQQFYSSPEWNRVRKEVIARDYGRDLGIEGNEIYKGLYVHHIEPITFDALQHGDFGQALNPNNLITVSFETHNTIHYGRKNNQPRLSAERRPGDTKLW